MYCPRCGQQQISEEMKFCSRCGLSLIGLPDWIIGSGLPAEREPEIDVSSPSPRRKGMRRAAKLLFLSGVLLPVFLVFSLMIDEGAPMIVPAIILFVALIMMLYAYLFGEEILDNKKKRIKKQRAQPSALDSSLAGNALPPASNIAMQVPQSLGKSVRTAEFAQPPSVTEHTTKLLDDEGKS